MRRNNKKITLSRASGIDCTVGCHCHSGHQMHSHKMADACSVCKRKHWPAVKAASLAYLAHTCKLYYLCVAPRAYNAPNLKSQTWANTFHLPRDLKNALCKALFFFFFLSLSLLTGCLPFSSSSNFWPKVARPRARHQSDERSARFLEQHITAVISKENP